MPDTILLGFGNPLTNKIIPAFKFSIQKIRVKIVLEVTCKMKDWTRSFGSSKERD